MSRVLGMAGPKLRTEILDALDQEGRESGRLLALALCGGIFVSLGLLQQNIALVAAAVLFAALSAPLLALSLALVRADLPRSGWSVLLLLAGMVLVVVAGVVTALIARFAAVVDTTAANSWLLLPAQSSVLTAIAALAAGGLAAYALVQPRIPAIGVDAAIAAVLLPPLSLTGIGLTLGHATVWHAALWQIVMNGSAVLLGAAAVFLSIGYRPGQVTPQQVQWLPGPAARFAVRTRYLHLLLLAPVLLVLALSLAHSARGSASGLSGAGASTPTPLPTARAHGVSTASLPSAARSATLGPTLPTIGLTPVALPTAVRAGTTAVVTGTHGLGANVRQAPGMTTIIAVLTDGTTVKLTGKSAVKDGFAWLQVKMATGKTGWVTDIFLQLQ